MAKWRIREPESNYNYPIGHIEVPIEFGGRAMFLRASIQNCNGKSTAWEVTEDGRVICSGTRRRGDGELDHFDVVKREVSRYIAVGKREILTRLNGGGL